MSILALSLVVVVLVTRLPLLLIDRPVRAWEVALTWATQSGAALLLLGGFSAGAWAGLLLAAIHVALHAAWWWLERWIERHPRVDHPGNHLEGRRQILRLGVSTSLILLAIVLGSPWAGALPRDFGPWLQAGAEGFSPLGLLETAPLRNLLIATFGLLLCLNETNALIRWVIEHMRLKPRAQEPTSPQESTSDDTAVRQAAEQAAVEYKRGRLIGVLERIIIFALVLGSQYTALAFVLTAKSMARFKSLDDREFAEYFLLGTMMSVALAGAIGLAVRLAWQA